MAFSHACDRYGCKHAGLGKGIAIRKSLGFGAAVDVEYNQAADGLRAIVALSGMDVGDEKSVKLPQHHN